MTNDNHSELEPTEQTPLVNDATGSAARDVEDHVGLSNAAVPSNGRSRAWGRMTTEIVVCILILVITTSAGFLNIPMTRIYEDILCRKFYGRSSGERGPIREDMCKEDAIQSELAYLFAVMHTINAAISCLVAMPWGIAADR